MSHVHNLRFEALEARQLLTTHHPAMAHPAPAAVAAPMVLDGTLAVDNNPNASMSTSNPDGSTTTSLPVAGRLGALGEFRGVWNETVDPYGDITGLDVLRLHDPKGNLIIAFNNETPGPAQRAARGEVAHEQTQRVYSGSGAYARASETGSIELITNPAQTLVVSLALHTRGS
jgi:hypothetical protein